MNRILLLLIIIFPYFIYGQCKKERLVIDDGIYYGCLNDIGQPHGEGKFKWNKIDKHYEGEWENGKMSGIGKLIISYINNQGYNVTQTYTGGFLDGKKRGENGEEIIEFKKKETEQTWNELGEFKFDILYNGIKTIKYNTGEKRTITIENGEEIKEESNRENYYDKEDIIGNTSESIVDLERRNNQYYIKMSFNGIEGTDCHFDSGAHILTIGKRLYNRLIDEKVDIRDLNQEVYTSGIGGESKGKYVIFDEIGIGDYIIKDVVAIISLEHNYTLVGIGFFDKFSNIIWNKKENQIKLYK
tara:strand:+ start:374 stop:1273 length:900 start_codon:yes stop_codon:yes gene_type:complete